MQKFFLAVSLSTIIATPLTALGVNEVAFVGLSSTGRVGEVRIMDFKDATNYRRINCGDGVFYFSDYARKKSNEWKGKGYEVKVMFMHTDYKYYPMCDVPLIP